MKFSGTRAMRSKFWQRNSRCRAGSCVEVILDGTHVLVRDRKQKALVHHQPEIKVHPDIWRTFLAELLGLQPGERNGTLVVKARQGDWVDLVDTATGVSLSFTFREWATFSERVRDGEMASAVAGHELPTATNRSPSSRSTSGWFYLAVLGSLCSIVGIPLAAYFASQTSAVQPIIERSAAHSDRAANASTEAPTYLSDLPIHDSDVGSHADVSGFEHVKEIDDGKYNVATLGGDEYEDALVSYGRCEGESSWVKYRLDPKYKRLNGLVGISDASDKTSSVEVEIWLDGRSTGTIVLSEPGKPVSISRELEGVFELKIETRDLLGPARECGREDNTITAIDFVNLALT